MTIITGGLPRDPELRTTQAGKQFTTFTVADSRRVRDDQGGWKNVDESYIDVTLWGDDAAQVAHDLAKGSQVAVDGRFVTQTWERDGQKQSKLVFKAWRVYLLVKAPAGATRSGSPAPAGGSGAASWGDGVPDAFSGVPSGSQGFSTSDAWAQPTPNATGLTETPF